MSEPIEATRPLTNPRVDRDGNLRTTSVTTHESFKIRGAVYIQPTRVIPVVLVPGVMGSNLKATTDPKRPQNQELKPGESAWKMPNGRVAGLKEADKWKNRHPAQRQRILDGTTLEVDNAGDIPRAPPGSDTGVIRKQGWGEVHADTYGALLFKLQTNLNRPFAPDIKGELDISEHWKQVMACDPARWGVEKIAPLTRAEMDKLANFHFPVYAFGYNWLLSNGISAELLEQRILNIIAFWAGRKHQCRQVILVTHSMGGLVARACAKRIPEKIAGIVHGVMPALGAPVAYRRIACGTESSSPTDDSIAYAKFAEIAGMTAEATTPVMATAAGPLELLPNHLYPQPWLFAETVSDGSVQRARQNPLNHERHQWKLGMGNPYDFYRDLKSWYRMINLDLVDPAGKYADKKGNVDTAIGDAINAAEQFHTKVLDTYYHPNTYAYYGADAQYLSYGEVRWLAHTGKFEGAAFASPGDAQQARPLGSTFPGGRNVETQAGATLYFEPAAQAARGDNTVPAESGAGPAGKIRQLFRTGGYGHAASCNDEAMQLLTQYLIAKIVQEVK